MRWLALLLVFGGCTEHGKGGGDAWDVTETQFATALCQNACVESSLQDECIVDVLVDMDQARDLLADSEEAQCIECMRIKIQLMPQIVQNQCDISATVQAQIAAVCGESDEACARLP